MIYNAGSAPKEQKIEVWELGIRVEGAGATGYTDTTQTSYNSQGVYRCGLTLVNDFSSKKFYCNFISGKEDFISLNIDPTKYITYSKKDGTTRTVLSYKARYLDEDEHAIDFNGSYLDPEGGSHYGVLIFNEELPTGEFRTWLEANARQIY